MSPNLVHRVAQSSLPPAVKLTPTQQSVLDAMPVGEWVSAYRLRVSRAVLEQLAQKKLIRADRSQPGAMFSPSTSILYLRPSTPPKTAAFHGTAAEYLDYLGQVFEQSVRQLIAMQEGEDFDHLNEAYFLAKMLDNVVTGIDTIREDQFEDVHPLLKELSAYVDALDLEQKVDDGTLDIQMYKDLLLQLRSKLQKILEGMSNVLKFRPMHR